MMSQFKGTRMYNSFKQMATQNPLSCELFWLGGKDGDETRLFWYNPVHTYMRREKHCFTLHLRKSCTVKSSWLTSKFFHEFGFGFWFLGLLFCFFFIWWGPFFLSFFPTFLYLLLSCVSLIFSFVYLSALK